MSAERKEPAAAVPVAEARAFAPAAPPIRRNSSRIQGWSDAVFGFSATLLVVTLQVPDTFPALVESLWGFVPFALSFMALALLWSTHHAFFRRYDLADRPTVALNAIFLFVVLFYVYPLKFMTSSLVDDVLGNRPLHESTRFRGGEDVAGMFVVYGLGFVAVFACFALLYRHAARVAGALGLGPVERHEAQTLARHYWILAGVGVLSIGLALTGIGIRWGVPGWVYGLVGPLAWWHGVWSARRAPQPSAAETAGGAAASPA